MIGIEHSGTDRDTGKQGIRKCLNGSREGIEWDNQSLLGKTFAIGPLCDIEAEGLEVPEYRPVPFHRSIRTNMLWLLDRIEQAHKLRLLVGIAG